AAVLCTFEGAAAQPGVETRRRERLGHGAAAAANLHATHRRGVGLGVGQIHTRSSWETWRDRWLARLAFTFHDTGRERSTREAGRPNAVVGVRRLSEIGCAGYTTRRNAGVRLRFASISGPRGMETMADAGAVELDVIAVGAHPDDVEIACGGTLARLARKG